MEGEKRKVKKSKMLEDLEIKHSTVSLSRDLTGLKNYPISFHSKKVFSGLLGIGGEECESKQRQKMSESQTHERFRVFWFKKHESKLPRKTFFLLEI